jgi:exportin-1
LALFLTSILGAHFRVLERDTSRDTILLAHFYLLKVSQVEDREIFKICLEYWNKFVLVLYNEAANETSPLLLGSAPINTRKCMYAAVLSELRHVMIAKMVKPEEVLIVEDENGEIVREFVKETDTITLYKSMRECLVLLTHLDVDDTESIMLEKLARQFDGTQWNWAALNKLCWAIGSISGAMREEQEKRFLVSVIKDLLALCEMKRGKDNKAVVASNIMYVVGQYPRFLKAHWKFLKTVINKLFEFMHELHAGVQDMACDTFLKITKKCHRHIVQLQPGENAPFIEEVLLGMPEIVRDLEPQQVAAFYEAIGYAIPSEPDADRRARLIALLMQTPNLQWASILTQQKQQPSLAMQEAKALDHILKLNTRACLAIGAPFVSQLGHIFLDMLLLYRNVSKTISEQVAASGPIATKTPLIRAMRSIKKDVLRLLDTYIAAASDLARLADTFVPNILDAILTDYQTNVPQAREAEVLLVTATMIARLGPLVAPLVQPILGAIFEPTLSMISKDFSEFPEHRVGFFKLLHSITLHCFPALLALPSPTFKLFMDSIVWAFKHAMPDIADIGLAIALDLLKNVAAYDESTRNAFYRVFLLPLLQDLFYVLTDTDHKAGFKLQALNLAHIFFLVENNVVTSPLYDTSQIGPAAANMNNAIYLRDFVINLLHNAFPHLQRPQVELFVRGLFDLNKDIETFKAHLRDFLVQLKEFAGDNTDLFREELELEQERKKKAELETAMAIPGFLKPSERNDDLDD